jgi:hypothetical protein
MADDKPGTVTAIALIAVAGLLGVVHVRGAAAAAVGEVDTDRTVSAQFVDRGLGDLNGGWRMAPVYNPPLTKVSRRRGGARRRLFRSTVNRVTGYCAKR